MEIRFGHGKINLQLIVETVQSSQPPPELAVYNANNGRNVFGMNGENGIAL